MSKYGTAAVGAARRSARGSSPAEAWEAETRTLFGAGTAAQCKGCPKGAFLGLCQEGLVLGVPSGSYTRSRLNKGYATAAVELLRADPDLAGRPDLLWDRALGGATKVHNSQMDVVIALWNAGLIHR